MREVTPHQIACVFALFTVGYCLDLPRLVIDWASLPLPILGGTPPYLVVLLPTIFVGYWAAGKYSPGSIAWVWQPADLLFLTVMLFWAALEVSAPGEADYILIKMNAWCFTAYYVVRAHLSVFRSPGVLVDTFLYVILAITCIHFVLLILIQNGIPPPGLQISEIVSRNGMSYWLLFAVFLQWFLRPGRFSITLPDLAIGAFFVIHALINGTRGAIIALVPLLAAKLILGRAFTGKFRACLIFALTISGAIAAATGYVILESLGSSYEMLIVEAGLGIDFPSGTADSVRSLWYRLATNALLLQTFMDYPIFGAGMHAVLSARVGDYISHTYYLMPLAAYGVAGVLPYLAFLGLGIWRGWRLGNGLMFIAGALVISVVVFVNDLWGWFGALAAITGVMIERGAGIARGNRLRSRRETQMHEDRIVTGLTLTQFVRRSLRKWPAGLAAVGIFSLIAAGWFYGIRDPYVASAAVAVGYLQNGGLPGDRIYLKDQFTIENYLRNDFLQETGFASACSAMAKATDGLTIAIQCTGETTEAAENRVKSVVEEIVTRHRRIYEQTQEIAAMERRALKERIAGLKKAIVAARAIPDRDPERWYNLVLLEDQIRSYTADLRMKSYLRSRDKMTALSEAGVVVAEHAFGALKLLIVAMAALFLGIATMLTLGAAEFLRERDQRLLDERAEEVGRG